MFELELAVGDVVGVEEGQGREQLGGDAAELRLVKLRLLVVTVEVPALAKRHHLFGLERGKERDEKDTI